MESDLEHKCAVAVAHSIPDVVGFMESLQHRGRDCAGIAGIGDSIDVFIWAGEVDRFSPEALSKILPAEKYHTFLGHTRYMTHDNGGIKLQHAHPQAIGGKVTEFDNDTRFISDCEAVAIHNGEVPFSRIPHINPDHYTDRTDTAALLDFYRVHGIQALLREIPGAYTIAFADKREPGKVTIARDRTGIRPGVFGKKNGKHVMASEDIAFRQNINTRIIGNLSPGAVYYFFANGEIDSQQIVKPEYGACIFEYVYFAHRDSVVNGKSVHNLRYSWGKQLGVELKKKMDLSTFDYVTFSPDSPEDAMLGFMEVTGMKSREIFVKPKKRRSFTGPDSSERDTTNRNGLFVLPQLLASGILYDTRALIIEDSVVRGTVAKRLAELTKSAGINAEIASYSPPVGDYDKHDEPTGCENGVNMPIHPTAGNEYLARGRTLVQIQEISPIPIHYISRKGFLKVASAAGLPKREICYRCFGGPDRFRA